MKTTFLVGKRNYFTKRRRGRCWGLFRSLFALFLLLTLLIVLPLSFFGILSLRWKDNTNKPKSSHHSRSIQHPNKFEQPKPSQQDSARKVAVEVGAKEVSYCSSTGRRKTALSKPCPQERRRIGNFTTTTLWQAADAYLPLSSEAITGFQRNEEKQKIRRSPALIRSWRDEWSGHEEDEELAGKRILRNSRSASCSEEVPECDFFLVGKDGKLPDLRTTTNEERQTDKSSSSSNHPFLFPTLRLKCCAEHQKMKRALFYVLDIVEGYNRYVNDVFGRRSGVREAEKEIAEGGKVVGVGNERRRQRTPRPLRTFLDSGTLLAAVRDRRKRQLMGLDERSIGIGNSSAPTPPPNTLKNTPPNSIEKGSSSNSCSPLLTAASSTLVPWDTDIDLGIIGGAPDDMLRAFGDGLLYLLNISDHASSSSENESLDLSVLADEGGGDKGNEQEDKTTELTRRRKRRMILLSKLQSEFQRDLRAVAHHLPRHSISAAVGRGSGNQEATEHKANDKGGYTPLYPKLSNSRGDWVGLSESSRKQLLATINPNVFLRAYADWWHWRRNIEGCPVDDAESAFESLFPSYGKYYPHHHHNRHTAVSESRKKSNSEKAIGGEPNQLTPSLHEMSWAPPHYFEPCVAKKKKRREERKGSEGGQAGEEEEVVMCKDAHYIYYAGTKDGIMADTSRVEVYPFRPYWGKPLEKKNKNKAASKDNAVRINDEENFFPLIPPTIADDDQVVDADVDVLCDEAHLPVESENNSPANNRIIGNGNDLVYEREGVMPMLRHPTRPWLDIPMVWAVLNRSQRCPYPKTTTPYKGGGEERRDKEPQHPPCVLWGRPVPCPAKPELYLDHCYGGEGDGSWRRPRTIHWGEKNVQPWK